MRSKGARGRLRQAYLLFGTRVVCQATRLAWAPLLIPISAELNLGHAQQGQVLSSFSFGYLFTQVIGGIAADRYGGKPVQTVALVASSLGMLLIPVVVDYGYWALCSTYFLMGICQGPQHPGYNAMAAIWFGAAERGWVSSVCEAGPVCGTLAALLFAPQLASNYGWRTAFTVFGMVCTLWSMIWQALAFSTPSEMPQEVEHQKPDDDVEEGERLTSMEGSRSSPDFTTQISNSFSQKSLTDTLSHFTADKSKAKPKTVARPTKFPWAFFTYVPVWGVIGQHMVFNTTRYFFADWTAIYYAETYGIKPEENGFMLTFPFVTGAIVQIMISGVEQPMIKKGYTPLQVRTMMGSGAFVITAVCLFAMTLTLTPMMFTLVLAMLQASMSMHACGYKANYMDLTSRYQGIFMGTGNTIASICTFGMPLGVAYFLEIWKEWGGIFMMLSCLNLLGVLINQKYTVVKELTVAESH